MDPRLRGDDNTIEIVLLHYKIFAQVNFFNHFIGNNFVGCAVFQNLAVVQNITVVGNA